MAFASQKGLAEQESVEEWAFAVSRVFCMLEPDQMVSFDTGARRLIVTSGDVVVVRVTWKGEFLNAGLRVHNIPVCRCLIAVRSGS
jgi:hypothetical protein